MTESRNVNLPLAPVALFYLTRTAEIVGGAESTFCSSQLCMSH